MAENDNNCHAEGCVAGVNADCERISEKPAKPHENVGETNKFSEMKLI